MSPLAPSGVSMSRPARIAGDQATDIAAFVCGALGVTTVWSQAGACKWMRARVPAKATSIW